MVAASTVTSSRPVPPPKNPPARFATALPTGEPCRFIASPEVQGVYSCTLPVDDSWQRWIEMKGIRPFVAATREEWFDPELHPSPDLEKLQQPE